MQEAANDPGELPADEAAFAAACAEASAGRLAAARDAFLALRARLPQRSASLELQLAAAHYRLGEHDPAESALATVIGLEPASYYAHALRARLRADRGDAPGAEESLREAERFAPGDANSWREIGALHAEFWRWDDANRALDRAEAADPGHPATASLAAIVKGERGDDGGARAALERALAGDPGDLATALAYNLYLPQVYESEQDLEGWRARYTRGLAEMAASLERWKPRARQALDLNRTNFLLAYQGGDDRELQRGYSRLLGSLVATVRPEWLEPPARRFDGSRRLRVGFAGSIFRDCTAGRYFEHWITGLDPRRFERRVYHASPVADEVTRRIAAGSDHFATLRADGATTIEHLRSEALDVLVQPEVGMWPMSYLLAAVRVAPVQCAGWGHPVTTGGDGIDAYFTCAGMEPADGATHYTEALVPLPGLGVRYALPPVGEPFARDQLRLPADKRLYVCPQSLFKIHPSMDAVFARLLAADPGGVLVFFQSGARAVSERFAARLQRALEAHGVAPAGQLKFLPRMNSEAFRRVLAIADVVVDTMHWSGGNTSLDALAAGTPIVTLPGRFMRGRQSAAMLRSMDLPELVAASPEDYVRRAIAVASDGERNRALRTAIAERRGALFDRPEPVAAFAEALLGLA
jgi:predicted O-linked N-acetylglucosamine transferase (SPINDLY family)/Flp pilus assembly protein TadD